VPDGTYCRLDYCRWFASAGTQTATSKAEATSNFVWDRCSLLRPGGVSGSRHEKAPANSLPIPCALKRFGVLNGVWAVGSLEHFAWQPWNVLCVQKTTLWSRNVLSTQRKTMCDKVLHWVLHAAHPWQGWPALGTLTAGHEKAPAVSLGPCCHIV
jgi:hypothetical protein